MAIKTRETDATGVTNKGAPLTNAEIDQNFIDLQQLKLDLTGGTLSGNLEAPSFTVNSVNVATIDDATAMAIALG